MAKQKINRYQKNLRAINKQKRQAEEARIIQERHAAQQALYAEQVKEMSYEDYIRKFFPTSMLVDLIKSDFVLRG